MSRILTTHIYVVMSEHTAGHWSDFIPSERWSICWSNLFSLLTEAAARLLTLFVGLGWACAHIRCTKLSAWSSKLYFYFFKLTILYFIVIVAKYLPTDCAAVSERRLRWQGIYPVGPTRRREQSTQPVVRHWRSVPCEPSEPSVSWWPDNTYTKQKILQITLWL